VQPITQTDLLIDALTKLASTPLANAEAGKVAAAIASEFRDTAGPGQVATARTWIVGVIARAGALISDPKGTETINRWSHILQSALDVLDRKGG
jgi:hypothetical protein